MTERRDLPVADARQCLPVADARQYVHAHARGLVGTDQRHPRHRRQRLPNVRAASAVATQWKEIAETSPNELHETERGSGIAIRGSAIVAIKAQEESKVKTLGGLIKAPRDGSWL
jgi:hypothetical protein